MITNEGLFEVYYDNKLILTALFNERFAKLVEYFKEKNIKEVCNLLLERFKNICIEDIQSISLKENNFTINQLCLYQ